MAVGWKIHILHIFFSGWSQKHRFPVVFKGLGATRAPRAECLRKLRANSYVRNSSRIPPVRPIPQIRCQKVNFGTSLASCAGVRMM